MEKNLLAEKIISLFRTKDTHTHHNVKFMTINEDAIRELFDRNSYLQELSSSQHDRLQKEMDEAHAAFIKAQADAKEQEAKRKAQADLIRQNRIDEKLKEDKQKEEERKKIVQDSRKAAQSGDAAQQALSFHSKSNMERAKQDRPPAVITEKKEKNK